MVGEGTVIYDGHGNVALDDAIIAERDREPEPISSIRIIDVGLETIIQANDDESITISTNEVCGSAAAKLPKLLSGSAEFSGMDSSLEVVEMKGGLLQTPKKGYSMEVTVKGANLATSLQQLKGFVNMTTPGFNFPPPGTKTLINQMIEEDMQINTEVTLLSPDLIKFNQENSIFYFPKKGNPLPGNSTFHTIVRQELMYDKQSNEKIQLFEKGIPSDILERLNVEIIAFTRRAASFFDYGLKIEKASNVADAIDLYKGAYMDFERARIIQSYIIDKEQSEDKRHEYVSRSRGNLSDVYESLVGTLHKFTKVTGNFHYLAGYIDFLIPQLKDMWIEMFNAAYQTFQSYVPIDAYKYPFYPLTNVL